MNGVSLTRMEFSSIQRFIEEKCGIKIGEEKSYLIESRLSRILVDMGCKTYGELYEILENNSDKRIIDKVIDAITTNETQWFRDKSPWNVLEDILLPQYIREIQEGKRENIRIWSAGCSTGQEPYSTAMAIDRYIDKTRPHGVTLKNFSITATDISKTVLDMAKKAKYDNISMMRGMDSIYKEKYFSNEGRVWYLDEGIKNHISFRPFNLQNSYALLGKFDVIFCRYVLIYFSKELKRDVLSRMAKALNPGGVLFMGSSEVFPEYEEFYNIKYHGNGVYYTRKGQDE